MSSLARFDSENKGSRPIEPNAKVFDAFRGLVVSLTKGDQVAYGVANRKLRKLGWSIVPIRPSHRGRIEQ